jgi:hypothetical protein
MQQSNPEITGPPKKRPHVSSWMCSFSRKFELGHAFEGLKPHTGDGELGCGGFSWGAGPPHATISLHPERCTRWFGIGHFLHHIPLHLIILRQRSGLHRLCRNDPLFSTVLMAPFFGRHAPLCHHNTHASNDRATCVTPPTLSQQPLKTHTMAPVQRWAFQPHKRCMGSSDFSLDSTCRSSLHPKFHKTKDGQRLTQSRMLQTSSAPVQILLVPCPN